MNGFNAAQVFVLVAGFGGMINGLMFYGGFVAPRMIKKRIPVGKENKTETVDLFMVGVFGNFLIGMTSGALLYTIWRWGQPVFQDLPALPTGDQLFWMLVVGLGGTTFIDSVISQIQWKALVPVLNNAPTMPDPPKPSVRMFQRAPRMLAAMPDLAA